MRLHAWQLCLVSVLATAALFWPSRAAAQEWDGVVRGSWVRSGTAQAGDVALADGVEIVIGDDAHSAVRQAATFLASDIEKLTGRAPALVRTPSSGKTAIHLVTLEGADQKLPNDVAIAQLSGKWEAYQVLTDADVRSIWLVGSDARGTAFAVYTLSERLGIDPLYHWTGYRPEKHEQLVVAKTNFIVDSPTIKYRGMFHDDEDILGRPFEPESGWPMRIGNVPTEWYSRFFETALRLRMNMVAPYTRVHRRFEVQKMASDWGLFYTSHHYDILLSNPFGYGNFRLAEKRGVTGKWDWIENRENMLKYWRGGVEENGKLDAIWPVGLRGTDDVGYNFPEGMSEPEQNRIFQEVINAQREMTIAGVADEKKPPVFHFTLYGEMLDKFLAGAGKFDMPQDVIIIWPDDNDGRIRALPREKGKWKHGVYYHLAYWGPVAKQSMRIVPDHRIATEFKKIVEHGATEYMLVNVSELREFVREARMIAEISWDAQKTLHDTELLPLPNPVLPHVPTEIKGPLPEDSPSKSADRFERWFALEYFGEAAAGDAARAYELYDELLGTKWDRSWWAGDRVAGAIPSLQKKLAGERFDPARPETLPTLKDLEKRYDAAFKVLDRAREKMNREQRQFFLENCELPLRVTGAHTKAARILVEALDEQDPEKVWTMVEEAMIPLEAAELDILRAERMPFTEWYRPTFIRHQHTGLNMHRPYLALRAFISSGGTERLPLPESWLRPNLAPFVPLLGE